MTDRFFNELKQSSKNKPSFQVFINGEWKVCDNIANLPLNDTTLGKYLTDKENAYNDKLEALQQTIDKQDKIIKELVSAIDPKVFFLIVDAYESSVKKNCKNM